LLDILVHGQKNFSCIIYLGKKVRNAKLRISLARFNFIEYKRILIAAVILSTLIIIGASFWNDSRPSSESEQETLLSEGLDQQVECWSIIINNQSKIYLSSEEACKLVLEGINQYYLPTASKGQKVEEVKYKEDVKVAVGKCTFKELSTPEKAVDLLINGVYTNIEYKVKNGDTLWSIASENKTTVVNLKELNPQIKNDFLNIGQTISLVKAEPLLTVVSTVVITVEEKMPFSTVYESDSLLWRGQEQVKQSGSNGTRLVNYRITQANETEMSRAEISEQVLIPTVNRIVRRGQRVMVASRGDGVTGRLSWPTRDRINSGYGKRHREFHTGIDIDGVGGDPIYAAEDGTVLSSGWSGHYGKCIVLDHGRGLTTLYGHFSVLDVAIGQKVTRGSLIGKMGTTGRSTGSHLHFEVRLNGAHQNPLSYLEK
jgi:murein DD-endopeptidase MepM/ murein hydrolase activator NlpD